MSSDLEKYLENKRQDLDVDNPDDQLIWEGIREELHSGSIPGKGRGYWPKIRNIAAVAVIVLCLGYMIGDLLVERKNPGSISLASLNRELGVRENEYKTLVAHKIDEVKSYNEIDNLIIAELYEEIQKLDTIYEQTMKDLEELGYNEKVINTIFDTYEKKIYLLELIILENNKIKNHETDQNIFL